jgi:hypothetical protein
VPGTCLIWRHILQITYFILSIVCYFDLTIPHDDLRFRVSQSRQHFDLPIARTVEESQFRYLTSKIVFLMIISPEQSQMYDIACNPHEIMSPEKCVGHPTRPEPR